MQSEISYNTKQLSKNLLEKNFFLCRVKGKKDFHLHPSRRNISPYGEIIVSASDMASYEHSLLKNNPCLAEKFMDIAALGLCYVLENKVFDDRSFEKVVLLIGKGHNGGDAYALGSLLLQSGYKVIAYQAFVETAKLSEKKGEAFEKSGGIRKTISDVKEMEIHDNDLVIDGLLGTGFKGKVTGIYKEIVDFINDLPAFVFSIDIPSGVDGDTGIVDGSAVYANITGYLGALKVGHLFEDGYEHVGLLHYVDFGMDTESITPYSFLANNTYVHERLPKRARGTNKYRVGEASIIAGTEEMCGAAELSCLAAYRSGCGLVRHFYLGDVSCSVREVISKKLVIDGIEQEFLKSKALLIGPGLGRSSEAKVLVDAVMVIDDLPMVIDGDALFLLDKPPENAILTPHKGELLHLLGLSKEAPHAEIVEIAQRYCDENNVIIIFKGMPTMILSAAAEKIVLVAGNPGMATAGSGDVLAGIIVSFLSGGCSPLDASLLGVTVHGAAGDIAASKLSGTSLIASDIIGALPSYFKDF